MTIRGGLTRNRAFGADGRGGGGTFCDDSSIGFKIGFKTNAIERTTFNKALDGFRFRRDKKKFEKKFFLRKENFALRSIASDIAHCFEQYPKERKRTTIPLTYARFLRYKDKLLQYSYERYACMRYRLSLRASVVQTGRVIKLTRFAVFALAGFDVKLAIDGVWTHREILWRQVPIVVSISTFTARGFFFLVARELFQVFPGFVAFLELFFVAEILEEDLVVDDGVRFSRKFVDG